MSQHPLTIYTLQKVTQNDFNRFDQSVQDFVFIMLGIIWKIDYFSLHWYFINSVVIVLQERA